MGNSRFSDGFLLGSLVGGVAIYLLTTKKGNKILKIISEEGIDGLTKLIEETQEHHVVPKAIDHVKDIGELIEDKIDERFEEAKVVEAKNNSKKRFFRKAKN